MAKKKNISKKQKEKLINEAGRSAFDFSLIVYKMVKENKIKKEDLEKMLNK